MFLGTALLACPLCAHAQPASPANSAAGSTPSPGNSAPPLQPSSSQDRPSSTSSKEAQVHFERAKSLYAAGRYGESLGELETAHKLDPDARDLVFNLALVQEKRLELDQALAYLRHYLEMNPTADERRRAEAAIKRLEGAKESIKKPESEPAPPPRVVIVPRTVERGRIDAFTIGAAAIGVVGLGVGIGFGLAALSGRPASGQITSGESGATYRDLADRSDSAHSKAVIADVGFVVGGAGLIGAAVLFFAREKNGSHPSKEAHFNVMPFRDGAQFSYGANF